MYKTIINAETGESACVPEHADERKERLRREAQRRRKAVLAWTKMARGLHDAGYTTCVFDPSGAVGLWGKVSKRTGPDADVPAAFVHHEQI